MIRLILAVSLRRVRRMKIVPALSHSHPAIGQSRISALATKRAGCAALMTNMSSHETWLAATIIFRTCAGGRAPCTSKTTLRIRSNFAAHHPVRDARRAGETRRKIMPTAINPTSTWVSNLNHLKMRTNRRVSVGRWAKAGGISCIVRWYLMRGRKGKRTDNCAATFKKRKGCHCTLSQLAKTSAANSV